MNESEVSRYLATVRLPVIYIGNDKAQTVSFAKDWFRLVAVNNKSIITYESTKGWSIVETKQDSGSKCELPPYGPNNVDSVLMVTPKRKTIVPGQTIVIEWGEGNLESGFDDSEFDRETFAYCDSVTIGGNVMTDVVFDWDLNGHCFTATFDYSLYLRLYADGSASLINRSGGRLSSTVTIAPLEIKGDGTEVELRWVRW